MMGLQARLEHGEAIRRSEYSTLAARSRGAPRPPGPVSDKVHEDLVRQEMAPPRKPDPVRQHIQETLLLELTHI